MARILLVEDNEWNRDMLFRRLSRVGFDVICAVDGRQAVELAGTQEPELILMDLNLPVMDGWEALKQLKSDPMTKSIPVIALTAHALTSDREKALEAGFDSYDSKPVEFPRLVDKMNALLPVGARNVGR